jgi:hypothetical protein
MRRMPGGPEFPVVGGQPPREGPIKGLRRSLKLGGCRITPTITQTPHQDGRIFFISGHQRENGRQNPMRDLDDYPTIGKLSTLSAP